MSIIDKMSPMQVRATTQDQMLAKLREGVSDRDRAQIKQSAEDFESLFLNIVLKSMRDTIQKSGLVDGGNAEDIYRSMLDDEYSKMMASQRHTGLADNIESFLLQAQGTIKAAEKAEKGMGIKAYQGQGLKGLQDGSKQETMDNDADRPGRAALSGRTKAL